MASFDLVVIGSGVGGYPAAIRASQLGLKVAIVEKNPTLGGTCLNVGCIPSKALLESSEVYASAQHFEVHGISLSNLKFDLATMLKRKDDIVGSLTRGVGSLLTKYKVTLLRGKARLQSPSEVVVEGNEKQVLTTKHVILATGSVPSSLKGLDFDGDRMVSSDEALSFKEVPKKLIVVGGGVIGVELGSVWARLGSQVTVLEYLDQILAGMDGELARQTEKALRSQGLEFVLSAKVQSAKVSGGKGSNDKGSNEKTLGVEVSYEKDGKIEKLAADKVLVAVGRRAYTDGLGLSDLGIALDKAGRVVVNDHYQTAVPSVRAIGDCISGPMLAHKAEEEGIAAAELIAGKAGHVEYDAIPSVVYTHPEVASVGKTEEQLKAAGIAYKKGSVPFMANGRAKALADTMGFVKILADEKTDRILGAHIIGGRAGDLIAELAVAMEFKASAEDIARSVHAHPTLAETIKEAAMHVAGRGINF